MVRQLLVQSIHLGLETRSLGVQDFVLKELILEPLILFKSFLVGNLETGHGLLTVLQRRTQLVDLLHQCRFSLLQLVKLIFDPFLLTTLLPCDFPGSSIRGGFEPQR